MHNLCLYIRQSLCRMCLEDTWDCNLYSPDYSAPDEGEVVTEDELHVLPLTDVKNPNGAGLLNDPAAQVFIYSQYFASVLAKLY